jgi:hypothetical protein
MENRHVCILKMTMANNNVNTAVRRNGTPMPPTHRPMIKGKAWKILLIGLACSQAAAKDGRFGHDRWRCGLSGSVSIEDVQLFNDPVASSFAEALARG